MTLRDEVTETLQGAGYPVIPWNGLAAGEAVIVRPGGIVTEREIVEVWIINPPAYSDGLGGDPDSGLAELAADVYNALRTTLLDTSVGPTTVYDPTGKSPRSAMVLTGNGRQRGLT